MKELFPPVFATNREETGETVAEEINILFKGLREEYQNAPTIAIATAFLNPAGFSLIADELEKAPHCRLLLGAEPDSDVAQRTVPPISDGETRKALEEHDNWLNRERDLTGFTRQEDDDAQRLVKWLTQMTDEAPAVEVRRYNKGFLHGKAFIAEHETMPALLAGSSNLTYAGLMRNAELNLGYPSSQYTSLVIDWFNHFWDNSEPYDLAEIYACKWAPHRPWLVFLRMLWELYGDTDDPDFATEMRLTGYQQEGVARMLRILDELGGVVVADEVGLGKTFMAGEIMKRATEQGRQQVLIVGPASLITSMWQPFLTRYDLSRRIITYSYDYLRANWDNQNLRNQIEDCALVVIDEAHNLRNPAAQRTETVSEILLGANPKKVVLLTATPVNNSLTDLQTLIEFFVTNDAQFAGEGITSIRRYIADAQKLDPDSLSPKALFDLVDKVMVRRTRRFVKEFYQGDKIMLPDGTESTIVFPQPELGRLDYQLNSQGSELLEAVIYALDDPQDDLRYEDRYEDPKRLMLSRYTPGAYTLDGEYEDEYQFVNAGLLRTTLLKRLESSPAALASTLKKLIDNHQSFLTALDAGHVVVGEALAEWAGSETEDFEQFLEQLDDEKNWAIEPANQYNVDALSSDVRSDLSLLNDLLGYASQASSGVDGKSQKLVEQLRQIATDARTASKDGLSAEDRRKTIIFSTFVDTINSAHEAVCQAVNDAPATDPISDFKGRIPDPVSGIIHDKRAEVLAGFAPETSGQVNQDGKILSDNLYDLLFATDVLSEGVNLQQAGRVVNYDLPWNPMRIVQRHGRIDRIGSKHPKVYLDCFFPSKNLDELLALETRLHLKLARADAAVGVGDVLPGFQGHGGQDFYDKTDQIQRIKEGDVTILDEDLGGSALSGEEYRRRLRQATPKGSTTLKDLQLLPYGSGSGFRSPTLQTNGYTFCARIGNQQTPSFRFVPVNENWEPIEDSEGKPLVVRQTLTAISAADPGGKETERHLPDQAYEGAFAAWEAVHNDLSEEWMALTDPSTLAPVIPKALRRARELIADNGEFLGDQAQEDLYNRLQTVPPKRVETEIRVVLNGDHTPREAIRLIKEIAEKHNLRQAPPPPEFQPVHESEIRLITWMAISSR